MGDLLQYLCSLEYYYKIQVNKISNHTYRCLFRCMVYFCLGSLDLELSVLEAQYSYLELLSWIPFSSSLIPGQTQLSNFDTKMLYYIVPHLLILLTFDCKMNRYS